MSSGPGVKRAGRNGPTPGLLRLSRCTRRGSGANPADMAAPRAEQQRPERVSRWHFPAEAGASPPGAEMPAARRTDHRRVSAICRAQPVGRQSHQPHRSRTNQTPNRTRRMERAERSRNWMVSRYLRWQRGGYATESRKATASPLIAVDSSIGTIGVTVKRSHGVHGAVVRARGAALSASMIATPPLPSAQPENPLNSAPAGGCHFAKTASDRRPPSSLVSTKSHITWKSITPPILLDERGYSTTAHAQ